MKIIVDADYGRLYTNNHGYLVTTKGEYVHRLVAEKAIGRKLKSHEHVHHIDYNKKNNKNTNLIICNDRLHKILHARTDAINAGFNPDEYSHCWKCKTYHKLDEFPKHYKAWNGVFSCCKKESNSRRRAAKYKRKPLDKTVMSSAALNLIIASKTKHYEKRKGILERTCWLW